MRQTLQKIDDAICKICGLMVGALIGALIILNFTQLVTRYFISVTFTWAEEVSTMMLIYITAIGAPWVTLQRKHLKMDAATKILSKQVKFVVHWIAHALILTMGIMLIIIGIKTTSANAGYNVSILGFDEKWRYIPLVAEGLLLSFAELITFLEDMLDSEKGRLVVK